MTKDTVPVDVDAVLFWLVWDAEKAALEVEDYRSAISWAAQTALRVVIGSRDLADILIGRAKMNKDLPKIIDERTTPWGLPCNLSRSEILSFHRTWKTPCLGRRRRGANDKRA